MIIGMEGGLGSGKTIIMVRYLNKDYKLYHRSIKANLWLDFPHEKLNIKQMLSNEQQLKNVSVGIDELTVFADCRNSMSELNKLISYFVLQTRKRNVCLYFTTQDFGMVDKRIMRHTLIRIHCMKVKGANHLRHYEIHDIRDSLFNMPQEFIMDIRPYFEMYNTDEIIQPFFDEKK